VAGVALRDIFTCVTKCLKSSCVTGAICSFQRFSVADAALWRPPMSMFHGKRNQAQHLRGVVLHERIAVAVLRQVVTTCKCRGSLGTL